MLPARWLRPLEISECHYAIDTGRYRAMFAIRPGLSDLVTHG